MTNFSMGAFRNILKTGQHFWYRFPIPLCLREARLLHEGPCVLANTIPKSGTNLLGRVIGLMPSIVERWRYHIRMEAYVAHTQVFRIRPGQVATAHWKWEAEEGRRLLNTDTRIFLMVRDPRDIVVSNAFYIAEKNPRHRLHSYFADLGSDEERILASMIGVSREELGGRPRSKSMGEHIKEFMPWIENDECMLVRFEDLIGEQGGGSLDRQIRTVRKIAHHLGRPLDSREIKRVADRAFSSDSKTFRKGKVGDWRNHFTRRHVDAAKKNLGDVLVQLGYEDGKNWTIR